MKEHNIGSMLILNLIIGSSGALNIVTALDPTMSRMQSIVSGGIGGIVVLLAVFTASAVLRPKPAEGCPKQ